MQTSAIIVVVDDEPSVRLALTYLLNTEFPTIAFERGAEAIDYIADHRPVVQVVIVDHSMVEMNGNAVCKAIRDLDPRIRLIGISGNDEADFGLPLFASLSKKYSSNLDTLAVVRRAAVWTASPLSQTPQ